MAEIVLGMGLSHSPQTCVSPENWEDLVERDRERRSLLGCDGGLHSYPELEEIAPPAAKVPQTLEGRRAQHDRVQAAVGKLAEKLAEVAPDVVVIVGDDQRELFLDDGMPMFGMYWGDELTDHSKSPEAVEKMSPGIREGFLARHAEKPESYPVESALSKQLVIDCSDAGFDIFQFTRQPAERSLGHAFTTVQRRIIGDRPVPMVPIFQNTYYPPNQPAPIRCWRLGETLRRSIEAWPGGARVAVIASGGLSHITVDEELDDHVLRALETRDEDAIAAIPREKMRFGSSEILNWVTAAGALGHLDFHLLDYIAGYRSTAGTGVGMTFSTWE